MIQNVLRSIGGIDRYGILSICLFFTCFLGILFWAFRLKRSYLDQMAALPLEREPEDAAAEPSTDDSV